MHQNAIVCFVVIIVIIVATVFIFTKSSYCNCTGMDTKVRSPPLNLWNAANGGMGDKLVEYSGPSAYGMISTAYDPSLWGALERDIATKASSGATDYAGGCACTTTGFVPNKIVPLEAVGASVPPGSVSNNVASYPVNRGYTHRGYNTAPGTSFRYGSYMDTYNPDMAVGIM